jgi:lysophospholipase L1-like esterase
MKIFSIAVLLFFSTTSCVNKVVNQKIPLKILFLGESTTVGQGASSPNENYVTKAIEFLKQSGIGLEYKVIAKSGMSSTWGITRLDEIYTYSPDLIIIEFLINDQYLSLETIKSNYEIFSKIPYGKIVLFELYDSNMFNKFKNNSTTNPILAAHRSDRWGKQIDTLPRLPNNWSDFLVDGTHPSSLGYSLLANILAEEISPIVTEHYLIKLLEGSR